MPNQQRDFNQDNVPKRVSDPNGLAVNRDFPRHMHRYDVDPAMVDQDGRPVDEHGAVLMQPKPVRRFLVVTDHEQMDAARSAGWLDEPPAKPTPPVLAK